MEFRHESVLLEECLEGLRIKPGGVYVDGTLGGGGHSVHICEKIGEGGLLIGIDQDDYALERSKKRLSQVPCRTEFVRDNFQNIKAILHELGQEKVDGILLDLGVSSFQLDDATRGFSYHSEATLDMRMDPRQSVSAYTVVNEYSQEALEKVIRLYGEERFSKRIASFIAEARQKKAVETTTELATIIKDAIPARFRREGPHPARRTFQGIRIEVNRELEILEQALIDAVDCLKPEGRLAVITFHSLEDRIVKNTFKVLHDPCTCPPDFPICQCGKKPVVQMITRKPIVPKADEVENNARSRSAKLRIVEKL